MTTSKSKPLELPLIKRWDEIGLDKLKTFPYWISSEDLDTSFDFWDEADPPEGMNPEEYGLDPCATFPKDFSRQKLTSEDNEVVFWTPDLIELAKKHNGILFICEGSEMFGIDDYEYPSVFVLLRFKNSLDRTGATRDIRRQRRKLPLFFGRHPQEPEGMWGADFWAIARSELEATFKKV